MMCAVEMYMIIAVTLMKTTLGLPQNCVHYCNFLPENSFIPPGCDCSIHNLRKTRSTTSKHIATLPEIKDTGIYYDPVKQVFFQNTSSDEETLHTLSINPILKSRQNTFNGAKKDLLTTNTGESFTEQDYNDKTDSKTSKQNKKRDTYFPQLVDETQEPLHLYLDIDITSKNNNRPQLEELKNMFANFQAAEKNLSECIDLHIYIFSKYIDTINKTNTNWGRKVQHDNLSSFQQLTEIQSKCDQPASIIKKSIYQIKQFLSREDKTTELTQDVQKTIYTADSYKEIGAQNATNEFGNVNATTSDIYPDALTTHPTDDISNNYNAATETVDVVAEKTNKVPFHKKYSEHNNHNLFYKDLIVKNNDITSTSSFYEDSTVYDKINLSASTDPTDYGELETTSKTDRTVLSEKDMTIPRIITKELSNGTLVSILDGYEKIPNSDFINNSIISTPSHNESNSNLDLLKPNIDELVQSDIVNIHGNLYISFGEKQIPARFIQQSDGKLAVAIDGFSMCHQIHENHTSNFMNSLCKCIVHKNCT